ncbi:MAG: SIMPL domain-containing protein [Acidobacteriota bacterium]|nr:SIMPL domain-containing protein [Acidobacteriota bacterium]
MTRTRFVMMMLALLGFGPPAMAQDMRPGAPARTVTTSGQAEVSLAPDQAWVTIGIEARAPKSQEAQRLAAEVMSRIQAQLKALGIPESAVRTVSFSLDADWNYANNKRTLRGYVLSNLVEVRVDDITKVADVLDRSIASGGNAIHGVRWDLKDRVKVERDALRRAVEDAKQRAEVAVTAAGSKLGVVSNISEQRHEFTARDSMMMQRGMVASPAQPAPDTPISPGEIKVRSTATVSFRIE